MPYEQDSAGQWWYRYPKRGNRVRCQAYVCDRCGETFYRVPSIASQAADGSTKFCSRLCSNRRTGEIHKTTRRGPGNPAGWSGGRKQNGDGYVLLWKPDHPNANRRGWVLEHRLVVERRLGRPLREDENVHHKNGVRNDNRSRNLELWTSSQPSGQRVKDLLRWARSLLARYEHEESALQ